MRKPQHDGLSWQLLGVMKVLHEVLEVGKVKVELFSFGLLFRRLCLDTLNSNVHQVVEVARDC